ncbi:MAG: 8-oxo-dGTP diphosphatase [Clostridia bacterium]|nr:8-oxo-dGTP diphosphatase [Clostridia bacterium]
MRKREVVGLTVMCMIRRGNEVVIQRRNDPNWPGLTLPGGHVEFGEPFTDAVIREVREETGLTIRDVRLCGVKNWLMDDGRYLVLLFKTDAFSGDLRSSDEGAVFWADIDSIPEDEWASSMPETLEVFAEDSVNELFYSLTEPDLPVLK